MSETTATSPLRLAKEHARAHLAATATWQRLTHTSDAEAAARHIYLDAPRIPDSGEEYSPDELAGIAPYIVLTTSGESSFVAQAIGTQAYDYGGSVMVDLFLLLPGLGAADSLAVIEDAAGNLMRDLAELAERPGHLAHTSISLDGFLKVPDDDQPGIGEFWASGMTLAWGTLRGGGE